jgi:hypothetical protein
MAGNIRIIDYTPRPNPNASETVTVVLLVPVDAPLKLADAIAAKAAAAITPDAAGWAPLSEVITYQPGGRLTVGSTSTIDPMIAAVLTDEEKQAVAGGALVLSGPRSFVTTRDKQPDDSFEHTQSVAELVNAKGSLFDDVNLAYNQFRKDTLQRLVASRELVGLRIDEVLLDNVTPDLTPPIMAPLALAAPAIKG